jgi:hypothetical protein
VDPRPGAGRGVGRRMGGHRGRARPAGRAARPDPLRSLRAPPTDRRGPAPSRGRLRAPGLPAPVRPDPPSRRAPALPCRLRPRPRRRRRVDGAVRSHPGAVGHGLRAREPGRRVPRASRHVPRGRGGAPGPVLPRAAGRAATGRPGPGRGAPHRGAHARAVERDGLRARCRRQLPRVPPRAGLRPAGARRSRLGAHPRSAGAGARHPPPRRSAVVRPAGAAARVHPRRPRPARGLSRRQRLGRQHPRQWCAREPRAGGVPPQALRGPARSAAEGPVGAHAVVR